MLFFFLYLISGLGTNETVKLTTKHLTKNLISATEILTIKDDDGFYESTLSTRTLDGKYLVFDSGNHNLMVYSNSGKREHSFGKEGSGPGEFRRVWQLFSIEKTIVVREMRKLMFFKQDGNLIKEISITPSIQMFTKENSLYLKYPERANAKNTLERYDSQGVMISSIKNSDYKKVREEQQRGFNPERIKQMLDAPKDLIPYGENYIQFYTGDYKLELLDKTYESKAFITREFNRISYKEDEYILPWTGRMLQNANDRRRERALQAEALAKKEVNGFKSDIKSLLGVFSGMLLLETQNEKKQTLTIDIISKELKLVSQIEISGDDILSATLSNDHLLVNYTNEDDGPYVKVYRLSINNL